MTSGSQRSAAAQQDFARPGDTASLGTAASGDLAVTQNRLFRAKTDRHDLRGRIRLPASVLIKVEIHLDPKISMFRSVGIAATATALRARAVQNLKNLLWPCPGFHVDLPVLDSPCRLH